MPGRLRTATKLLSLAIVLSVAAPSPALSQDSEGAGRSGLTWLSAGLGGGSHGYAGVVSANIAWDRNILSGRTSATAALFDDGYADLGVLYGRTAVWAHGLAGVSAGLGVVDGSEVASPPVLGIPVALRAAWHPLPVIGLGTYLFGNLNTAQPFAGLVLTVSLGWLE